MIILEKPYVSDFLVETIKKNKFSVLENEVSATFFAKDFLVNQKDAIKCSSNELFYSNSENSTDWILDKFPSFDVSKYIKISKDKTLFRTILKELYPDFYFREISIEEIDLINPDELSFPLILKPSVGFLSFGVHPIKDSADWKRVSKLVKDEINKLKGIFPQSVVNFDKFIIEEMIEGEEYALDAYFDENGEATILNIFKHPFFDDNDVSDRVYFTSKKIIQDYHDKFKSMLDKIGKCAGYKNFPFHLELRTNGKKTIPIEINPLRFCGWCITDIAYFAWGINVYEYYFKKLKPDWDEIFKNIDDSYFYFTMADIPSDVQKDRIKNVDYRKYLKNIQNPLEVRKINPNNNPVFAIVFAKTNSIEEIKNLLKLDMRDFIVF